MTWSRDRRPMPHATPAVVVVVAPASVKDRLM
jgi:hypothetical protein